MLTRFSDPNARRSLRSTSLPDVLLPTNMFSLSYNFGTHCKENQQKSYTILRYNLVEIIFLHLTRFTIPGKQLRTGS